MKSKTLQVTNLDIEKRLDVFLTKAFPAYSRSFFTRLIKAGKVLVNDQEVKPGYLLKENDRLSIDFHEEEDESLTPANIPLTILYEDDDLLVIDKPAGLVVHPGAGNQKNTLVNALLFHQINLSTGSESRRPGIVHRLDKETSGLIIVAKNDFTHQHLARQLQNRTMKRAYLALVLGEFKEEAGEINAPLGRDEHHRLKRAVNLTHGKEAKTYFKVLERFNGYTLLRCELLTGRTHQIRVHLAFIDHPVIGDQLYLGKKSPLYQNGQLLHAYELGFIHPRTNEYLTLQSPLPIYFKEVLDTLRQEL